MELDENSRLNCSVFILRFDFFEVKLQFINKQSNLSFQLISYCLINKGKLQNLKRLQHLLNWSDVCLN